MPHEDRRLMNPLPQHKFQEVFSKMVSSGGVITLTTTGGVSFEAEAKHSNSLGDFISLPHGNRIYPCCWGNANNHMGKEGQRIGQYARSLDEWC